MGLHLDDKEKGNAGERGAHLGKTNVYTELKTSRRLKLTRRSLPGR